MSSKCYKLEKDFNHSGDPEKDAFCLPFESKENFGSSMMGIEKFKYPSILYFTANFKIIPHYDFPLTDLSAPIISNRMLEVIKKVKSFSHETIPVIMIDDTYLENQFENGKLKSEVSINKNYVALHLTEYTNVFDKENSIYKDSFIFPGKIGAIEKLVLKEPEEGFPSIFRVKESIRHVFVSHETKSALEEAGIIGCVFEPVEVYN